MSTIKSSAEHLTLNADGASKDIKFQANGVEKASISSTGVMTSKRVINATDSHDPWLKGVDTNNNETFSLKQDGTGYFKNKVGVGTNTPTNKLEILSTDGDVGYFKFTEDNNSNAVGNPLSINYNAGLKINNAYSGASPTANGTKVAKIQLGTVTSSGYGAYGSMHIEATSTGYDSGSLVFATGSNSSSLMTERMRIDHAGRVTMPFQPAFSMYATSQSYGVNTVFTADLDQIEFDIGNNFNISTNRFTAPVSGRYLFTGAVQYSGTGTAHVIFRVNGSNVNGGWSDFGNASSATQSRILNLNQSDYVEMLLYHSVAGTTTGDRTRMTGHLIG